MSLDDAAEEFRSKLTLFALLFLSPLLLFAIRGLQAYLSVRRWIRNVG